MMMILHKRNIEDGIEDTVCLLYLLKKIGGKIKGGSGFLDVQLKLMKLVFLAELQMSQKDKKGLNFFYNIYKKGPCSKEVFAIVDDLNTVGLIQSDYKDNCLFLTKKGESVIDSFMKEQNQKTKNNNNNIFKEIDEVISKYGKLEVDELIEKVYEMDITTPNGKKINIGDTVGVFKETKEEKKPVLLLNRRNYKNKLIISSEWMETFKILCDPKFEDIVNACYV